MFITKLDCKVDCFGSFIWPLRSSSYPTMLQRAVYQGARWYQTLEDGETSDSDESLFSDE